MENCIFCKIVDGQIPCNKAFEDENILAFFDINPLTKGHCLIIPKKHFENIFDIDQNILNKIIETAKNLSLKSKQEFECGGVNIINNSGKAAEQSVNHFHLHIIPRYENDGLEMTSWWQSKIKK